MEYFDLNDSSCMWRLLNKYKPWEVYNLAAQSHVRVSFDVSESTVDGIAMGTLRLLNAARDIVPEARIYQASSSEMYGDNPFAHEPNSLHEHSLFMPASPYACAKLFAHNLVRNYRKAYGLHASSGILFNHESPRRGEARNVLADISKTTEMTGWSPSHSLSDYVKEFLFDLEQKNNMVTK